MFATVLTANVFGLRVSSGFQLALSSVLIVVMALAIAVALPTRGGRNWTPFAPHGIWAIGTAANILVWLFVGWEAVAQLAGDFRRPEHDLPRAMGIAFAIVTVLYVGLAVATIGVTAGTHSRVPLADLIAVGFGRAGRDATAVLAVALTMGTMNVYLAGMAKLAASLATEGALPIWLAGDAHRSIPRRPLYIVAPFVVLVIVAVLAGIGTTADLVRATSACFIAVYVFAMLSAIRILAGRVRIAAACSLVLSVALAVFSAAFLVVPVVAAVLAVVLRRSLQPRQLAARAARPGSDATSVARSRDSPARVDHDRVPDAVAQQAADQRRGAQHLLVGRRLARHDVVRHRPELHGRTRLALQVQPPRRRPVEAAVRGDHDEALAVAQRAQRHRARASRLTPGRRQENDR